MKRSIALTILAARLFSVPVAFVSLIDEKRQFFKSRYGLQITESLAERGVLPSYA